jgi:hypothetical protein
MPATAEMRRRLGHSIYPVLPVLEMANIPAGFRAQIRLEVLPVRH